MADVRRGDAVVVGRAGIRVLPLQRPQERDVFSFMESQVSAERPHGHIISDVAKRMEALRQGHRAGKPGCKVLVAGGPAIIHAGGREALTWLIEEGFVHVLFCGNALAAHDMEADLYGTSLGYGLSAGRVVPHGHEHHLRTINRVRGVGSIEKAVESGVIKQGIMAACVRRGVHLLMAGTIRDDGPLPFQALAWPYSAPRPSMRWPPAICCPRRFRPCVSTSIPPYPQSCRIAEAFRP